MNILFGFTWVFNPSLGGTERVTDILARQLRDRGHNIYYLHTVNNRDENYDCPAILDYYISENIVDTEAGKSLYEKFLIEHKIDVVINQGGLMGTCKFFTNTNLCKKIVVIHFDPQYGYNYFFNELWALRNNSFIEKIKRIARCMDYFRRKKHHYNYLNNLYSYWFQSADRVCLLSNHSINDIIKVCDTVNTSKLITINNPNTFSAHNNTNYVRKKQVLWVGRLDMKQKRPDRIIRIWKMIYKLFPEWNLVIAGDGEAGEYLRSLARKIPSIEFVGRVDIKPYYQESEIICLTSTTEGWGMVLTEAISYGVVPLAFNSFSSVNEIIKSSKQLIQPFKIKEYAKKLAIMMGNGILREDLRNKGYKIISNYSADQIGLQWESVIQSLIYEK